MNSKHPALPWLILLMLSLIWGSSFIMMKRGLLAFDAVQIAGIRLGVAALCLLPFALALRKKLDRKDLPRLLVIGLTGNAIPAFLFAEAEKVIPSSVAGVMNSMSSIFILVIAWVVFKRRFPWYNVLGLAIGLAGAVLITVIGSSEAFDPEKHLSYTLLVVLATICYAISANFTKEYFYGHSPVLVAAIALSLVGWPSLVYLLAGTDFLSVMQTDPDAGMGLFYIAILGAVGTAFAVIVFNYLLQISSIIFASSVTYTIPIVALMWGILDGEALTIWHGLGFVVILAGVYLVNRK